MFLRFVYGDKCNTAGSIDWLTHCGISVVKLTLWRTIFHFPERRNILAPSAANQPGTTTPITLTHMGISHTPVIKSHRATIRTRWKLATKKKITLVSKA